MPQRCAVAAFLGGKPAEVTYYGTSAAGRQSWRRRFKRPSGISSSWPTQKETTRCSPRARLFAGLHFPPACSVPQTVHKLSEVAPSETPHSPVDKHTSFASKGPLPGKSTLSSINSADFCLASPAMATHQPKVSSWEAPQHAAAAAACAVRLPPPKPDACPEALPAKTESSRGAKNITFKLSIGPTLEVGIPTVQPFGIITHVDQPLPGACQSPHGKLLQTSCTSPAVLPEKGIEQQAFWSGLSAGTWEGPEDSIAPAVVKSAGPAFQTPMETAPCQRPPGHRRYARSLSDAEKLEGFGTMGGMGLKGEERLQGWQPLHVGADGGVHDPPPPPTIRTSRPHWGSGGEPAAGEAHSSHSSPSSAEHPAAGACALPGSPGTGYDKRPQRTTPELHEAEERPVPTAFMPQARVIKLASLPYAGGARYPLATSQRSSEVTQQPPPLPGAPAAPACEPGSSHAAQRPAAPVLLKLGWQSPLEGSGRGVAVRLPITAPVGTLAPVGALSPAQPAPPQAAPSAPNGSPGAFK